MPEPIQNHGRKIVLLSDGTGNSAGKLFKTNVWRLYETLDLSNASQIAFYDDGVGTSSFKPLAVLGGVFGWGLKRNVLDLYTFLCRNYKAGDRIYGFGFSRGAFTIRLLVRFVLSEGLVDDCHSNDELRRKALRLYREFRRKQTRHWGLHSLFRPLRNGVVRLGDWIFRGPRYQKIKTNPVKKIEFLGLWDTVDAYGLPIETLERGIDRWVWPLSIDDTKLHDDIKKACHALSIDDKRKAFHPLLWNEPDSECPETDSTDAERLTQVWFAGVHANVGGGYPDDSLSSVPLRWIIYEAQKLDLTFNRQALALLDGRIAPYGPIYDSRAGLGAYYQYKPRPLDPPCDWLGAWIPSPKIHETVFWRMAAGADAYAPLSLPKKNLRVVTGPSTAIYLPPAGEPNKAPLPLHPNVFSFDTYQGIVQTGESLAPAGRHADAEKRKRAADEFKVLEKLDDDALELIWDTVWWRRIVYYMTLGMTLLTLAVFVFPEWLEALPFNHTAIDDGAAKLADTVAAVIAIFLPSSMSEWLYPLRYHPILVFGLFGMIGLCLYWGRHLDRRIHDRALRAWNNDWRKQAWQSFLASIRARYGTGGVLTALAASLTVFGAYKASGAVQRFRDFKLETCRAEQSDCFDTLIRLAIKTGLFSALTVVGVIVTVGVAIWLVTLWRMAHRAESERRELRGMGLWFANRLRRMTLLDPVFRLLFGTLIPVSFAILLVATVLYSVNRASFAFQDSAGLVCQATERAPELKEETLIEVHFGKACIASKFGLKAGNSYEITVVQIHTLTSAPAIEEPGFWTTYGDPVLKFVLWPMRRRLNDPWHSFVARVGDRLDEHYVIKPEGIPISPRKGGELFVFVNDAILGVPYAYDILHSSTRVVQLRIRLTDVALQKDIGKPATIVPSNDNRN